MTTLGMRFSKLDLEEARQLYEQGLSFSQVGLRLGYSATYLARRFKAAAIPARPEGRPLSTPAPPVDLDELVALREKGWTFPRLAARYGLSNDAVRTRYLRAKGVPLRRAEAARRGIPWAGLRARGCAEPLDLAAPRGEVGIATGPCENP